MLNLAGSVTGGGLMLVCEVLVARLLGVRIYGLYAVARGIAKVGATLGGFGLPTGTVHFLSIFRSRRDNPLVAGTIVVSAVLSLASSSILAGLVWIMAPWLAESVFQKPEALLYIRMIAAAIPFMAIGEVAASMTRGFGVAFCYVLARNLTPPVVYLAAILTLMQFRAQPRYVVYGFVLGQAAAAVVGILCVIGVSGRAVWSKRPRLPWGRVTRYCSPIMLNQLLYIVAVRIDLFFLMAMAGTDQVGIYGGCLLIVVPFEMIAVAFNAGASHLFPAMAAEKRREQFDAALGTVIRWTALFVVPMFLIVALNARDLLLMMGPGFGRGALALVILAGGYLFRGCLSSAPFILVMCGRQRVEMVNAFVTVAVNFVLNWVMIPRYGIFGAAAATSISFTFVGVLQILEVWYYMRLRTLRPVLARSLAVGALVGAVVWVLAEAMNIASERGPVMLILRILAIWVLFAGGAWWLVLRRGERANVLGSLRKVLAGRRNLNHPR